MLLSSESQSSDDNKKRRVLSLAQYLESKKPILSPSSTINLTRKRLTDSQIDLINAQFQATTEKLTATASNLTTTSLLETDKINHNPILKKPRIEQTKPKSIDLWAEDDDDDDDVSISNSD